MTLSPWVRHGRGRALGAVLEVVVWLQGSQSRIDLTLTTGESIMGGLAAS